METTYAIEFMRPAKPTIASIKQPSAFHVAYYCRGMSVPPSGAGLFAASPVHSRLALDLGVRLEQLSSESIPERPSLTKNVRITPVRHDIRKSQNHLLCVCLVVHSLDGHLKY